jgi:hypothetical protein
MLKVMAAAAKLGLSITVSQVGGKQQKSGLPVPVSGEEWLSTMSPEEDALLNQLRALLLDARDAPPRMFKHPCLGHTTHQTNHEIHHQ